MPAVPIGLFRGVLALMALFFAHFLGRAIGRKQRKAVPAPRATSWILRLLLALVALWWSGGFDSITVISLFLSGIALGLGFYLEHKPRPQEDLTNVIFPEK